MRRQVSIDIDPSYSEETPIEGKPAAVRLGPLAAEVALSRPRAGRVFMLGVGERVVTGAEVEACSNDRCLTRSVPMPSGSRAGWTSRTSFASAR